MCAATTDDTSSLLPVYLMHGSDRPKVRRAVARLRRRVIAETGSDLNVSVFDADAGSPSAVAAVADAVLEATATPGFTLGTRLLLVRNTHLFKAPERKRLAAYVVDPMPDTCLALEGATFGERDALRKAVHGRGGELRYDLPKKWELAGWVVDRARHRGLKLPRPAAGHLLARCGDDPERIDRLEREIDKLAAYCGERPATEADVDAVCTPDPEATVFELIDAVARRDRGAAFMLLEELFAGGGGGRNDANGLLYLLIRHLQLVESATQLGDVDQGTAARQLGVKPYRARKLLEQRRFFDARRLGAALRALADADAGMRGRAPASLESEGGVAHGDRLVLELALARLTA